MPVDVRIRIWILFPNEITGFSHPRKRFEFCFVIDRSVHAPTEIFASEHLHYPGGPETKVTSNIEAALSAGSRDLWVVTPTTAKATDGEEVGCVYMTAKGHAQ